MPKPRTRHYPALDGLRGFAALAVVAYHVSIYFQFSYVPAHAYLAVDFFFMLSGYVIAYAYDSRLARTMTVPRFVLIRVIRLYPLAALGVFAGTMALLGGSFVDSQLHPGAILEAALFNGLLLPTNALLNVRALSFPTDSPLWSLAFEIWINVIYALLFRVLTRLNLGIVLVIGAFLVIWAAITHGGLNIGFYFTTLYLGAIRVTFPFVAGVLVQRILAENRGMPETGLAHLSFLPLILVLLGPDTAPGAYDAAVVLLAFPAILWLGTLAPVAPRLDRIWAALGALSYPLYVLHFPIVVVLSTFARQRHWHGPAMYLAAFATFAFAVAISAAAYRLYDLPLRKRLTRRLTPARQVVIS